MLNDKTFKLAMYKQVDLFVPNSDERGLAIFVEDNDEPYAIITVNIPSMVDPNVCEVIGILNSAYIDTNNYPKVADELINMGVAKDTGYTKRSGYCVYPLLVFNEDWLKEISGTSGVYEEYRASYARVFES